MAQAKSDPKGRYCLISDPSICYEGGVYRANVDGLRSIKEEIETLPDYVRDQVREMIGKATSLTLNASREIYDPLLDESKLEKVLATNNDYKTDMGGLIMIPTQIFGVTRETRGRTIAELEEQHEGKTFIF